MANFIIEDFTQRKNEKGEQEAVNDRYLVQKKIDIEMLNLLFEIKSILVLILQKP